MEYYEIRGGVPLRGSVRVQGAKNSALPLLAAALLSGGECLIRNCPVLADTETALEILSCLGCRVRREGDAVAVDAARLSGTSVPDALMGRMRASVLFLGALLARTGEAEAGWPGGCALGDRPIDLHIRAFRALGARVACRDDRIVCTRGAGLRGCGFTLPYPSVGATENAMLAACAASGVTEIRNAAREPEIGDLQAFLRAMGAEVSGAGTDAVVVRGRARLHPAEHTVMPDRIAAATFLCAAASAGGEVLVEEARAECLGPVLSALEAAGCALRAGEEGVFLRAKRPLRGIGPIRTGPYPAFPTDAQPLLAAALAGGTGSTEIRETVFPRRFRYGAGLRAMGAGLRVEGQTAFLTGRPLHGAELRAEDLRGGAALVIAALGAEGISRVRPLTHIDRGYQSLEEDLRRLGARILRRAEGDGADAARRGGKETDYGQETEGNYKPQAGPHSPAHPDGGADRGVAGAGLHGVFPGGDGADRGDLPLH